MWNLKEAFDKFKDWFQEETTDLIEFLKPHREDLERLIVAHIKDIAINVGSTVVQGIHDKKSADEIKDSAVNAVKVSFKVESNELLHEAATKIGLAVAQAHLDIHPDYSTVNK